MINEIIISQGNHYNEFCKASYEHLYLHLNYIAVNLPKDSSIKLSLKVRETGRSASITINWLLPNRPFRLAPIKKLWNKLK